MTFNTKIIFAFATLVTFAKLLPDAQAQVSTRGCGSPILLNSRVDKLQLVCNQNNPEFAKAISRFNDLAARKILSRADLQTIANGLNEKIDKISDDTDRLLILMTELLNRLDAAIATPSRAPAILRPYLAPAVDVSNQSLDINEFLDANGKSEYRLIFNLEGNCRVYVKPPERTATPVNISITSDAGSSIWRTLSPTQGTSRVGIIPLSTGTYQFIMFAKRGAGQFFATLSSQCN